MSNPASYVYNFMTEYEARVNFPADFVRGQAHCGANRIISGDGFILQKRIMFNDIPTQPGHINAYTRGWNTGHDVDVHAAPKEVWEKLTDDDRRLLEELGHAEKFI